MIREAITVAAALVATAVLTSCGDDGASTPRAPFDTGDIELTLRSDDGARKLSAGRLTCRSSERRATGALIKRAPIARLCSDARALAAFLEAKKPARRVCRQVYGGPQTAQVMGMIDGRRVDRVFTRTNSCEIEDYARVAKILPG